MILADIRTIYANLPNTIGGYTIASPDDYFTVVLNQNLCYDRNMKTYQHELSHINNGDFDFTGSADLLEIYAHSH